VVESFGYPNDVPKEGEGNDRIKILEDTNGDGTADKMTIFADGLRHATTSVFANGGIIITDGTEIVFLKDTNGNDKADTRKVLADGLRIWDTHASTSNFHYGIDNWIYATVGYSGIDMHLNDQHHEFGASVFRFRPDLTAFEHLQTTTNNTWGLGISEEGDIMGSTANNNPSWILSNPSRLFRNTDIEPGHTPRADTHTFIYPNTFDITQVDQIDRFTAAASHGFYTDNLLENTFSANHAFITEPTGHLVGLGTVEDRDSLKDTHFQGNNIFASADAWSSPVVARTGPDGAVWIADWYNAIIQHNVVFRFWNPARDYDHPHSPFHVGERGPGPGNAYITPLRDRKHGRIWRIVPANKPTRPPVTLDATDPPTLLQALHSPSQHTRLHAQRLLIESNADSTIPDLVRIIENQATPEGNSKPLAAIHAIWTLEGLGGLATPGSQGHNAVRSLLAGESDPLLQRHALLALGPNDAAVINALPTLITNTDNPRQHLFVLQTAAETNPNEPIASALWQLVNSDSTFDNPQHEAARLAMRRQGTALLSAAYAKLENGMIDNWLGEELDFIARRLANSPQRPALFALMRTAPEALQSHIEDILDEPAPPDTPPQDKLPEHLQAGYNAYMRACIECHQADGKGVEGTFPPLIETKWVKGHPDTLLRIILGGMYGPLEINGVHYNNVMPGHSHASDEELAAIASYVRHAFGKLEEEPITPEKVEALRPELKQRNFTPYTAEELLEKAKDN